MRIRRCLAILLVFCITFFLVQFYFLWNILAKPNTQYEASKESQSIADLDKFLEISRTLGVPIISVDRNVLLLLENGTNERHDRCFYFCQQKVASFATINTFLEPNVPFVSLLKSARFTVLSVYNLDAKLASDNINSTIATHFIITRGTKVIHLTILHVRIGRFWWHGSLRPFSPQLENHLSALGVYQKDFKFAATEGAYDIFDYVEVKFDKISLYIPKDVQKFLQQLDESEFIECNYTRAKIFHNTYKEEKSEDELLFKEKAMEVLAKATRALNKLQVPFWLSSGTCLGYYRQCDIITYSRDVDIGIFIKDYHPVLSQMLVSRGLRLVHSFGRVNDSFELSFVYHNVKLDIFFFYEEDDHVWNGGTQVKTGRKFKYIFPRFRLCWTDFNDVKLRIPCDTEEYIEANYGRDWFEPVRNWDWKSSPFNVHDNGVWPVNERSQVIRRFPSEYER